MVSRSTLPGGETGSRAQAESAQASTADEAHGRARAPALEDGRAAAALTWRRILVVRAEVGQPGRADAAPHTVPGPVAPTTSIALAAVAAAVIFALLLRLRRPLPWLLLLALLPVLLLELDAGWRSSSFHGLMHASIVYELLERGPPPGNPLLAGTPLRYPYAHHWLIAQVMRAVPLPPTWLFAATNLLCLPLFLWTVDAVARRISGERRFRAFAGLFALCGTSPFHGAPLRGWLDFLPQPDRRIVPFTKFTTVNSNQLGLVLFALALLGLTELARQGTTERGARWRGAALVAAGIGGAGVLYPYLAASAGLCAGAAALLLWLRRGGAARRGALLALGGAALGTAAAAPFLVALVGGSAGGLDAAALLAGPDELAGNLTNLLLLALLPAALALLERRALVRLWRERGGPLAVLLAAAALNAALHAALSLTDYRAQYKFAALAMSLLAFPAAAAAAELHARRPLAGVVVAFLACLPSAAWCVEVAGWSVATPTSERGPWLEPRDPDERELARWIADGTPAEAVLLDTELDLPALARRPLLVGPPRRPRSRGEASDGWGNGPEILAAAAPEVAERRRELQRDLRARATTRPERERVLELLLEQAGGRPLFVVEREALARARLAELPRARLVFEGPAAAVFAIEP